MSSAFTGTILIRSRLTSVAGPAAAFDQILDINWIRYIELVDDNPLEFPIDGTLDLHTFSPKDIESLVPEYIQACLSRGVLHLRIVHGKGTGALRRIVHSILDEHPAVISYRHEGGSGGSWGATVVDLKAPE